MRSILFCACFLLTSSWAVGFPTYLDFFQDLIDIFNSHDAYFDGMYDVGSRTLRVKFYHTVILDKVQSSVRFENSTYKLVNLALNIPLTKIAADKYINLMGCLVDVQFGINSPTPDEIDLILISVVYKKCSSTDDPEILAPLADGITKKFKSKMSHYVNGRELRFKIIQHRLNKFLYWV